MRRVVAANTALHTADPGLAGRLAWACHAAPDGTVTVEQTLLDYQRLTQELRPFRPSLFVQGATASDVPDAVLAAYDAPFPDESFCAGPRQLPLLMGLTPTSACARLNRRTMDALPGLRGPAADGVLRRRSRDAAAGPRCCRRRRRARPGRDHVTVEGAGHFLQEDRGARLADVVAQFVGGTLPHLTTRPASTPRGRATPRGGDSAAGAPARQARAACRSPAGP